MMEALIGIGVVLIVLVGIIAHFTQRTQQEFTRLNGKMDELISTVKRQ